MVFIWKDYNDWYCKVAEIIVPYMVDDYKDKIYLDFKNNGEDGFSIEKWYRNSPIDIGIISEKIFSSFTKIRLFHATKIYNDDMSPYLKNGLICDGTQMELLLRERANRVWNSIVFHEVQIEDISKAFDAFSKRSGHYNYNRLFLQLDDRNYLEGVGCDHYLLYGSERLICIADDLAKIVNYNDGRLRKALLEDGVATIIHFDVPLINMQKDELEVITSEIIRTLLWNMATNNNTASVKDITINFNESLPPEFISGFYHPYVY